ncbi:MAG: hypothetical protein WC175_04735 [Candidatus Dojkabacteria bacterium]
MLTEEKRNQIYDSVKIHRDYLYKINKGYNIDITQDKNNLDYDVSPYAIYFFTAPDCQNILNDELLLHHNEILSISPLLRNFLCYSQGSPRHFFIPLLSNTVEMGSATPMDLMANTREVSENRLGVRQVLSGNVIQNMIGGDISFNFRELYSEKLGGNVITKLVKAWMKYIEGVTYGTISPGDTYTLTDKRRRALLTSVATVQRVINYASSIYYFKFAPNGKTITYYGKWTGVFPKMLGTSSISSDMRENIKIPVTFQSQAYDDLDTDIISEFNIIAKKEPGNYFKIVKEGNSFNLIFQRDTDLFDTLPEYDEQLRVMPGRQEIG